MRFRRLVHIICSLLIVWHRRNHSMLFGPANKVLHNCWEQWHPAHQRHQPFRVPQEQTLMLRQARAARPDSIPAFMRRVVPDRLNSGTLYEMSAIASAYATRTLVNESGTSSIPGNSLVRQRLHLNLPARMQLNQFILQHLLLRINLMSFFLEPVNHHLYPVMQAYITVKIR